MRTGCRAAGPMSETAPSSTCKSRRARSRRWLPGLSSTKSRSPLRRSRVHAGNPSAGIAPEQSTSLVELLQGRLAKGVMDRVCRKGDGLFPSPQEIKLSCSCPDWADMCKHVAAALYGVGARLDEKPQLLFVLRGVDENELLAIAGQDVALSKAAPPGAKVLADSDVAALFGLEMAEPANSAPPITATAKRAQRAKPSNGSKAPPEVKIPTEKISKSPGPTRTKSEPKWATLARARKKRAQRQLRRSA